MSSIYVFADEVPALVSVASGDSMLLWDTSAGLHKRCVVSAVRTAFNATAWGAAATSTIGFYGQTAVDQGTMTATGVTALATATISAGNAAGVWAWASSTEAIAFVTRAKQAQTDLKTLIQRIESTGLLNVAGV